MFELIPAIDIREGRVVRLSQGKYDQETRYASDPKEVAHNFIRDGARRIHLVDLDGAREGKPVMLDVIKKIIALPSVDFQIGGGIRDPKAIDTYLNAGAHRVICGSKACLDESFLKEVLQHFGEKVIVGVDAKNGFVATDGWTKISATRSEEIVDRVLKYGGAEVIYTDIARDGMMSGPNTEALRPLFNLGPVKIISSGGISSFKDIEKLLALKERRLIGAITGKAIYEQKINLADALKAIQERTC